MVFSWNLLLAVLLAPQVSALPITAVGYEGPFTTGAAPLLVATDAYEPLTGDSPSNTFSLPESIETNVMVPDPENNNQPVNIFDYMATFTPYHESNTKWSASPKQLFEYALPAQCNIRQAHLLSRHGARYDDEESSMEDFVKKYPSGSFTATGDLEFLSNWQVSKGLNELTTYGNKELFDKGAKLFYRYGLLAQKQTSKIHARATTMERVTASANYFLSGFFGLEWQDKAELELIIDAPGFNSTLSPSNLCTTDKLNEPESNAKNFRKAYLNKAKKRLNKMLQNAELTISEVIGMQKLCGIETVSLGSSDFCKLFTLEEWKGFNTYYGYRDYNLNFFGHPKAKANGMGWLNDLYARISGNSLNVQTTNNSTLQDSSDYKENIYFDFTHSSVILNVLTALDIPDLKTQYSIDNLGMITSSNPVYEISDILPFASQIVIEIIDCDGNGVPADRSSSSDGSGSSTTYVHALLNDRTLSLDWMANESRADGWVKLDSFLSHISSLNNAVNFQEVCFGNYTSAVTDGVPQ